MARVELQKWEADATFSLMQNEMINLQRPDHMQIALLFGLVLNLYQRVTQLEEQLQKKGGRNDRNRT